MQGENTDILLLVVQFQRHNMINFWIRKGKECCSLVLTFKYVPTERNPADNVTRGLSIIEFNKVMPTWLHGPEYLTLDVSNWPKFEMGCISEKIGL